MLTGVAIGQGIRASLAVLACLCMLPASGGSISGTVKVDFGDGKRPTMRPLPLHANPDCKPLKTEHSLQDFLIAGENGELANVLVRVVGGLSEKTYPVPAEEVTLSQKGCVYAPHVFAVRVGQTILIQNPDGINHNSHMLPRVNTKFNKSMNERRKETKHIFKKAEDPFSIKCDIHNWMQSYCAVMDHPFFAVTGKDGQFTIEDLPPGEYEIEAWHELQMLETQRAKVTVPAKGDATIDFTFRRKKR